jgi:hypothetical protein
LENIERAKNKRTHTDAKSNNNLQNNIIQEELQLDGYRQFVDELESTVYTFANETNNTSALKNIQNIYADKSLTTTAALNKILFELKSASAI